MNILCFILHLLYPTRCPVCGKFIGYTDDFCIDCKNDLTLYSGSFLPENSDGFTAAFVYDEKISPAVILLKDGICGNAAYALGNALAEKIRQSSFSEKIDTIIPVPLYKADKQARGYNQSELIAKEVAKALKINICTESVIKHKKTQAQKKLTKNERAVNLTKAFSVVRPDMISGKNILIIDDVCTTGSTFTELAKTLRQSGALHIYCASCCKTPLSNHENK